MKHALLLIAGLVLTSLTGCASLRYYGQAIGGHLDILARSQPIDELLSDRIPLTTEDPVPPPAVSPQLRERLLRVQRIRRFATEVLNLPDNGSYTTYADLERPMVAWNVIATPEFSFKTREWCYPFSGCVPYRGYFSRRDADHFARELQADGLDVRVAGVAAYSTLGWFRDPVLNMQLQRDDVDLAALIFHELAHQTVYVPGDATFNESFATTVENEGLRRWELATGAPAQFDVHRLEQARHEEFVALVHATRLRLEALYACPISDAEKRAAKARQIEAMRADYARLRSTWNGYDRYDRWFAQDLNNAHLATVELYHRYVPAFQAMLAHAGRDLPSFYQAVRALSKMPPDVRAAHLQQSGPTVRAGD